MTLEKLGDYLYKIKFTTLLPYVELNTPVNGACTSYLKDGKLYRNLDWSYDKTLEFLVECDGFKGMSMLPGVETTDADLSQLPYHLNDGVNDYGIMVSTHVLYNDFNYVGTGSTPITKIPFIILSTIHDIEELADLDLVDLKINQYLIDNEYLLQFFVTNGVKSYVITPSDNGYELIDISENPKLTNFKWVNKPLLTRSDADLQLRPTGIERWNAVPVGLDQLRFTKAYETADYISEFIGINGTTKNSTDEELIDIYNTAHAKYLTRSRNGELWHTVHSVVYGGTDIISLYVQENYERDIIENIPGRVKTPLGKVKCTPVGAYVGGRSYFVLDIVTHNGSSFIARQNVPGNIPLTNPDYWQPIGSKGDRGYGIAQIYIDDETGKYFVEYEDGHTQEFGNDFAAAMKALKQASETAATNAAESATSAGNSAEAAAESASTASGAATAAGQSATTAADAATAANSAKTAVEAMTADATVDNTVGTPSVDVTSEIVEGHRVFHFSFQKVKGIQGEQGIQGNPGVTESAEAFSFRVNPNGDLIMSSTPEALEKFNFFLDSNKNLIMQIVG